MAFDVRLANEPDGSPAPAGALDPQSAPSVWRRLRRILVVVALGSLVVPLISFAGAVLAPSNSSFGIRAVEWLRDNGAAGLVSKAENIYYTLSAPSKGGAALRRLPQVGVASSTKAPVAQRHTPSTGARARHVYLPARLAPILDPALPGEGVWHATRPYASVDPPLLVTTFRSQPDYPRELVAIAWINRRRTTVGLYPGRQEPSVALPRGTMDVPNGRRAKLLATFNSGFKLTDARGGFAVGGHTYARMQPGIGTLVGYAGGRVDIVSWHGGGSVPPNVAFARQNLPLILDHGRVNPNLSDGPEWGATLGNAVRVWRSAVGIDRHGNLLYAAGDHQTVGSIAAALRHAGAVRAIELDINSYWVSFISYGRTHARSPRNLLPAMVRPASRYLSPDDRDFFAVYAR
jgi:hypothetical protein